MKSINQILDQSAKLMDMTDSSKRSSYIRETALGYYRNIIKAHPYLKSIDDEAFLKECERGYPREVYSGEVRKVKFPQCAYT